jgi:hypothetical protein
MAFSAQARSFPAGQMMYNPTDGLYYWVNYVQPQYVQPIHSAQTIQSIQSAKPAQPKPQRFPGKSLNQKSDVSTGRTGRTENFQHRTQAKEIPTEDEILRPYAYACRLLFDKLVRAAQGAFHNMPETDKVNRVIGINLNDTIDFTDRAGIQHSYQVHTLLYGRRIPNGHYTHRENTFRKYHIASPFVAAQIVLMSKGIRLVNESDPAKGFTLHLRVYKEEIPTSAPLWHRQNLLPSGVPLNVDLDSSDYDDITCVYLAPLREAALYVNSSFEKTSVAEQPDEQSDDEPDTQ